MTARSYIPRPTEHAAIRAACRSARPTPSVPALMAALLDANERRDREGVALAAHRVVRAAAPEVGE
uniref:Amidase n=1 Tax=Streptomyces sp. NBC_00180 TaxID=2903632 RepID=A0AAU1I107_9ACTN